LPEARGHSIVYRGQLSHLVVVFTDSCSCFQAAVSVIDLGDLASFHDAIYSVAFQELCVVRLGF
jgi:hypothetical protein